MILTPEQVKKYGHYFPDHVEKYVVDAFFNDYKPPINIPITKDEYKESVRKWEKYNIELPQTALINDRGREYEQSGNISAAINEYENNVGLDKYPAPFAYDRLMVLYRRLKDYCNEIRILNIAIQVFPKDIKYKQRLEKVQKLINNK